MKDNGFVEVVLNGGLFSLGQTMRRSCSSLWCRSSRPEQMFQRHAEAADDAAGGGGRNEDDMVHSAKMGGALKILERMVNQNAEDEIFQDFKYWEVRPSSPLVQAKEISTVFTGFVHVLLSEWVLRCYTLRLDLCLGCDHERCSPTEFRSRLQTFFMLKRSLLTILIANPAT